MNQLSGIRYSAALFDMDGVIVDTREQVSTFWKGISGKYGVEMNDEVEKRFVHGCTADYTIKRLFSFLDETGRRKLMDDLRDSETSVTYKPIPNVKNIVRGLKRNGVPVGLVTGAEPWKVLSVKESLQLEDMFDVCVTARDVNNGKPDPEPYLLAAETLGVQANKCVVFEDAESGIVSGKKSGALCVGIGMNTEVLMSAGADFVEKDFRKSAVSESNSFDKCSIRLRMDTVDLVFERGNCY